MMELDSSIKEGQQKWKEITLVDWSEKVIKIYRETTEDLIETKKWNILKEQIQTKMESRKIRNNNKKEEK